MKFQAAEAKIADLEKQSEDTAEVIAEPADENTDKTESDENVSSIFQFQNNLFERPNASQIEIIKIINHASQLIIHNLFSLICIYTIQW